MDNRDLTLSVPQEKDGTTVLKIQEEFFDETDWLMGEVKTVQLGRLVRTFCHMSQAWALGRPGCV